MYSLPMSGRNQETNVKSMTADGGCRVELL
jgi:hypothetical protein